MSRATRRLFCPVVPKTGNAEEQVGSATLRRPSCCLSKQQRDPAAPGPREPRRPPLEAGFSPSRVQSSGHAALARQEQSLLRRAIRNRAAIGTPPAVSSRRSGPELGSGFARGDFEKGQLGLGIALTLRDDLTALRINKLPTRNTAPLSGEVRGVAKPQPSFRRHRENRLALGTTTTRWGGSNRVAVARKVVLAWCRPGSAHRTLPTLPIPIESPRHTVSPTTWPRRGEREQPRLRSHRRRLTGGPARELAVRVLLHGRR